MAWTGQESIADCMHSSESPDGLETWALPSEPILKTLAHVAVHRPQPMQVPLSICGDFAILMKHHRLVFERKFFQFAKYKAFPQRQSPNFSAACGAFP